MFKISTGLRNHLLTGDDLAAALNGGVIRMYSGTEPATADAAIGAASLMVTISNNGAGTGINFETTPANGILSKATAEVWLGTLVASGNYSFYRFSALADAGAESTTEKRVQGTIGILNQDLLVSSVSKTIGDEQRIDSYAIGMPASA